MNDSPAIPAAARHLAAFPPFLRDLRARKGETVDLSRALRAAVRQGGDTPVLPWRRRKPRQRRILLLIDVSGSMKDHTESALRFAHVLHHAAERMECFTLGTRLTRVTRALRLRNPDAALAEGILPRPRLGRRHAHRRRSPDLPLRAPASPAARAVRSWWCFRMDSSAVAPIR